MLHDFWLAEERRYSPPTRAHEGSALDAIDRLREICLDFPEASERETWTHPTFRVRDKIFAIASDDPGFWRVTCKARPGVQAALVASDPDHFFVPAYVGPKGWVGIALIQDVDWDHVADLIDESYRMTAPKRLVAQLEG